MNTLHDLPRAGSQGSAADALERLFELTVLMGEAMEQDLRRRHSTRARAALLWVLHHRGPLKQAELAQALRVTPRNVTGLLDGLQAAGLVARSPHPTDRRATLVTLTGTGAAAAKALQTDQLKLADYLFTGISPAEVGGFVVVLERLLASLHAPAFSDVRKAALRRWPPSAARRRRVRKTGSR